MTREQQFAYIDLARKSFLPWATGRGIPLRRIEFVVPFVETNFGLSVWFFYETDEQLGRSGVERWPDRLTGSFIGLLRTLGYAPDWLTQVVFTFDSHENVVQNYEGSYFYRLR